MLDIYYVFEGEDLSDPPTKRLVASLALEHHRSLTGLWEMADAQKVKLSYFEDVHIDLDGVKLLLALVELEGHNPKNELHRYAVAKLRNALRKAVDEGASIVAICD